VSIADRVIKLADEVSGLRKANAFLLAANDEAEKWFENELICLKRRGLNTQSVEAVLQNLRDARALAVKP
jgi:hypothetical protein